MQLQTMLRKIPLLVWVWLGLAVGNWLFYLPFVQFGWPGIYPLATFYSQFFSLPVAIVIILIWILWPLIAIACTLAILLVCFTRKRSDRRILIGIFTIPLLAVAMYPIAGTCVHRQSLDITSWGKSYRVAYVAFAADDTYGSETLFECDRWGILCRSMKSYSANVGGSDWKLQYNPKFDDLTLSRPGADTALYRRTRHKVICNEHSDSVSRDPDCAIKP
jgi:signal transduction histidine kinase